jgi:SAM-dependent methyltransferase
MLENTELLRNRFLERLLALQPESVLDIGCGAGPILQALGQAGIGALGIEPSKERCAELRASGMEAQAGRGETADFPENSFDWVIYRHVLHHVAEPRVALQNAVRIARSGLLLAEPYYDVSIPSHERAQRVNRWVLAQDRRLGHVHNPPLNAGDMRSLLPQGLEYELSSESFLRLQDRPVERFVRESAEALESLAADDPQRREYESLLAEVSDKGHAWNGTLIVQIRIRSD